MRRIDAHPSVVSCLRRGILGVFMRFIVILALAATCGGCASITRGTTDQVQIVTDPPSAEVRTSMGQTCVTPCTLQFGRKDEFTVTASKPGYHAAEMPVTTRLAG